MNEKAPIILVSVVLLLSVGALGEKDSPKMVSLHHFSLACGSCHESDSAAAILRSREDRTNAARIDGDINQLCATAGCHDFDPAMSHPVGVTVNSTMAADMPLDNHSRITCLTCHGSPKASSDEGYIDFGQQPLLRLPRGILFCSTCHMKMERTRADQSHWQFSTRAHLAPTRSGFSVYQDNVRTIGGIDTESRTCLSCHEDISASIRPGNETPRGKKNDIIPS